MDKTICFRIKVCRLRRGPHLFGPPPDIPIDLCSFKTYYLLYYTESAFELYFREQKIQFGYASEGETKERWRK